jgi:2-polyprenyl-3-methyl-5-hydroxy-6-metoxy-1,4-benzoquinol methylase
MCRRPHSACHAGSLWQRSTDLRVLLNRSSFRNSVASAATISKDDFILRHTTGRSVLDIGCIDHSSQNAVDLGAGWLHRRIRDSSAETVGLDMLEADAAELSDLGYTIRVGDAQAFDLGRTFEVVVAGDIIEHLNDFDGFFTSAARHMDEDSVLLITTPNAFNVEQFFSALLHNKVHVNQQHTVWFDPRVLFELVSRTDLEITDFTWVDTRFVIAMTSHQLLRAPLRWAAHLIMRYRPILRRDFGVTLKLQK